MGIVLAERRKRNKSRRAPTAKQLAARRRFSQIMKNGGFKKRAKKVSRHNPKYTAAEVRAAQRSMLEVGWSGLTAQEKAILEWYDNYSSRKNPKRTVQPKGRTTRKKNVAAGFHDEDGIFHPIRASYDYDAKRTGESSRGWGYARKGAKKMTRRNPPNPRYRKSTLGSGKSTWTPEYRKRVAKASTQVRRQMRVEGKLRSAKAPANRTGRMLARLFGRYANPSAIQQHQALMKEWLRYEKAWRAGRLDAKGRVKQMQLERRLRRLEATIARQNPGRKIDMPGFGPRFKRTVVMIKARRVIVKNTKRRNPKPAYNMFRGRPVKRYYNVATSNRTPTTGLNEAGPLKKIILAGGYTYRFNGRAKLMYKGNRIYFGGWKFAKPNPPGEVDLGEIKMIEYVADKPHIEGDNLKRIYFHKMGEKGGERPRLIIEPDGMPFPEGGDYEVTADGIVN